MEFIELSHKEVNNFFKKRLDEKFNQELLEAIYDLLPQISAYKEEDKVFSFKVAIGYNFRKNIKVAPSSFFEIKRYSIVDENNLDQIKQILKETVIFCSKNADLYIDQVSETEIAFGVFFTDYKQTGLLERKILQSNALILEGFPNEGIQVLCNDLEENFFIRFSFSKNFKKKKYSAASFHWSDECRYWDGIFKKAKQTIHGTICLIVKPQWSADDNNFTGGKVTEFQGVSIGYSKSMNAQELLNQQYCIEMFLSMLDYDGVTILDTDGKVRSYHNIVKITRKDETAKQKNKKVPGGARHNAFDALKNTVDWEERGYVGIYFQSQEGEVEYYDFESENSQDYFKSEVMNFGYDNSYLAEVKSYYEQRYDIVVADWKKFSDEPLFIAINELEDAHFGWENFQKEIAPAKRLFELLQSDCEQLQSFLLERPGVLRKLVNALIISYVGNCYGNSDGAAQYVRKSLNIIGVDLWENYFREKDFIYEGLLRELNHQSRNQCSQWKKLLNIWEKLGINLPENIQELDAFWWRYRAFLNVEDMFNQERQGKMLNE